MPESASKQAVVVPGAPARAPRPPRVRTLSARRSPLASPVAQLAALEAEAGAAAGTASVMAFRSRLDAAGWPELHASALEILQL
ncbi:MAG: hypothetical protein ABI960_06425, partial [Candidatus Eisenbacteria bacterium]